VIEDVVGPDLLEGGDIDAEEVDLGWRVGITMRVR
jgi:hypothetical protein